ncbi:MAG TPA: hypothetical protein VI750_00785 [Pyrinomonadaceae bacterium]|nr:hypothetical protein [Pyrinomonadaceae bacterium]
MMTDRENQLQELKRQLQDDPLFQAATTAAHKLKRQGCDILVLQAYIARVAGYKSGNLGRHLPGPDAKTISRTIKGIQRHLRRAASQLDYLNRIWGFWGRMVEANCFHMPEELNTMVERLSCVAVKGFGEYYPQREAVLDALELVKTSTGRYHYTEVSTLINAERVWRALKNGKPIPEPSHDVDALKMIVQRHKKSIRESAAKDKQASVLLNSKLITDPDDAAITIELPTMSNGVEPHQQI